MVPTAPAVGAGGARRSQWSASAATRAISARSRPHTWRAVHQVELVPTAGLRRQGVGLHGVRPFQVVQDPPRGLSQRRLSVPVVAQPGQRVGLLAASQPRRPARIVASVGGSLLSRLILTVPGSPGVIWIEVQQRQWRRSAPSPTWTGSSPQGSQARRAGAALRGGRNEHESSARPLRGRPAIN